MDITQLGFGCVSLSSHRSIKNALTLLDKAYEMGITYFDTAPLYGQGFSEKILGKFLANKRNRVTVATKVGLSPVSEKNIPINIALLLNNYKRKLKPGYIEPKHLPVRTAKLSNRLLNYQFIKESVEKSFKKLNTNYISLLF